MLVTIHRCSNQHLLSEQCFKKGFKRGKHVKFCMFHAKMLVLVKEQRGLFARFDKWTTKASPGKEVAKADILIANESRHVCYSFVFERS